MKRTAQIVKDFRNATLYLQILEENEYYYFQINHIGDKKRNECLSNLSEVFQLDIEVEKSIKKRIK